MNNAIQVEGLVKTYKRTRALNGLTLSVPQGSIFALVGSNGAGKTTLMSIAAGLVKPDRGRVDLLDRGSFDPARHAGRVAILPQDSVPPRYARVDHLLYYYALLQGMNGHEASDAIREVLGWVNLKDRQTASIRSLSHGMLRRFTIAQAFIGKPDIVLLDEPMSGLDPVEVTNIRKLIRSRRGEQTIVISSHILHELETVCDQVAFVENGRLVRQDAMAQLTRQQRQINIHLSGTPPVEKLRALVPSHEVEFDTTRGILHIHLDENAPEAGPINGLVLPVLLEAGCEILEIARGSNLEDEYLKQRKR